MARAYILLAFHVAVAKPIFLAYHDAHLSRYDADFLGMSMNRREFLSVLGSAAAWPKAVRAQQPAMPVIGFLNSLSPDAAAGVVAAFRQGLREAGFAEGQNLAIMFRWAVGDHDRLPALARELVGQQVSLLFASGGPPAALAAQSATSAIPIVFSAASDPVKLGLVESLSRPGGNITGMSAFATELAGLAQETEASSGVNGHKSETRRTAARRSIFLPGSSRHRAQ